VAATMDPDHAGCLPAIVSLPFTAAPAGNAAADAAPPRQGDRDFKLRADSVAVCSAARNSGQAFGIRGRQPPGRHHRPSEGE